MMKKFLIMLLSLSTVLFTHPVELDLDNGRKINLEIPKASFLDLGNVIPQDIRNLTQILKKHSISIATKAQSSSNNEFVILHGESGAGKHALVTAMAAEAEYYVYNISPADIFDGYLGSEAYNIKKIFEKLREFGKPVLVNFFHIDLFGMGEYVSRYPEHDALNSFMLELDNLREDNINKIFVVATTCYLSRLSKSLVSRARVIQIKDLNESERISILRNEFCKTDLKFCDHVYNKLGKLTDKCTCRDLEMIASRINMSAKDNKIPFTKIEEIITERKGGKSSREEDETSRLKRIFNLVAGTFNFLK